MPISRNNRLKSIIFIVFIVFAESYAYGSDWKFDFEGLGPIKLGMSPVNVRSVIGTLKEDEGWATTLDTAQGECAEVYFPGFSLRFYSEELKEISVSSDKFRMLNGIGIGSGFGEIERLHGKASNKEDSRVYKFEGHYSPLVIVKAPSKISHRHPGIELSIMFDFETDTALARNSRIQGISIGYHSIDGCGP